MQTHLSTPSSENQREISAVTAVPDQVQSAVSGLRLAAPVPPQLEAAVEYRGEARFFGIFWQPAGDEAMVTDGRTTHDGCWWGYQAFVDHPLMMLALAGHHYDLGSSDTDATHWLIIDRETRTIALAPRPHAEAFLTQQHPALPTLHLTRDDWLAVIQAASAQWQAQLTQTAEMDVRARLAAQNQIIREMTDWLNARLATNWQQHLKALV